MENFETVSGIDPEIRTLLDRLIVKVAAEMEEAPEMHVWICHKISKLEEADYTLSDAAYWLEKQIEAEFKSSDTKPWCGFEFHIPKVCPNLPKNEINKVCPNLPKNEIKDGDNSVTLVSPPEVANKWRLDWLCMLRSTLA